MHSERLLLQQLAIHCKVHFSAEQFWMQYKERKLALCFIVTILKITTIHNYAHFPSFKTVPQLPISHFSLVSWKIHLCKYSVCWLSVIVSGPCCLLQLYLGTMSKSSLFLPRGCNFPPVEEGNSDLWEKSQQSWILSCCVPQSGHMSPKPGCSSGCLSSCVPGSTGGRRRDYPGSFWGYWVRLRGMWGALKGECVETLEDLWIWGRLMSDEAVGLGKNWEKSLLAYFSSLLLPLLFLQGLQERCFCSYA